ncbi:MAG: hypothetical protein EAZ70_07265 [Runella slithyformis]|jgi:hypothetical protein|nr:MAG: hypothetical protein EAZ80_07855 [Runella slithyformis]TAF97407.1 MAG: hypothetical protein EAZ46_02200 [Runella sp.]TAG22226.1 MAG: hypothetical protein EAZ38_06400 [Cytophagales bacterium]TAG41315.1 MAG: hypothetical protein EAZ32_03605 [Cytophagia bacterium]TAF27505.1 MAG: hypothetical protein EAZ70_07265 [Runella slithyformis]
MILLFIKRIVLILNKIPKWSFVIVLSCTAAFGQRINIGGGLGGFNYKGDIAPQLQLRNYRPGGHALFRYNVSPAVSFRTGLALGSTTASDKNSSNPFQQERNLSFKTNVTEFNLLAEYNFLNYLNKPRAINWTPYLFAGGAVYHFQPKVKTGAYNLNQIAIPFGAGLKWEFKRPWSIEFEFGTRKLFTDNFDDLGDDTSLRQKFQLGDPTTKDMYYYTSFTLSYTFYKIICPPNFSVN